MWQIKEKRGTKMSKNPHFSLPFMRMLISVALVFAFIVSAAPYISLPASAESVTVYEDGGYLYGVPVNYRVSQLRSRHFRTNLTVRRANGTIASENDFVCTGYTVQSGLVNTTVVIRGDVDGDGFINSLDCIMIRAHLKKVQILSGAALKAADANAQGSVGSGGYILVKAHLKNMIDMFRIGSKTAGIIPNDIYYLNNSFSGMFLRRPTQTGVTLNSASGMMSSLGNSVRWEFIHLGGNEYAIKNAFSPTSYLYAYSSTEVRLSNASDGLYDAHKWIVSVPVSNELKIKSKTRGTVLTGNADGSIRLSTDDSTAIDSKRWRYVRPGSYNELQSFLVTPFNVVINESKTPQLSYTGSWAAYYPPTWVNLSKDFTIATTSPFVVINPVNILSDNRISGRVEGNVSLTVTHKPTGKTSSFAVNSYRKTNLSVLHYYDIGWSVSHTTPTPHGEIQNYQTPCSSILYDLFGLNVYSTVQAYGSIADACKGTVTYQSTYNQMCTHKPSKPDCLTRDNLLDDLVKQKGGGTSTLVRVAWTGHLFTDCPPSCYYNNLIAMMSFGPKETPFTNKDYAHTYVETLLHEISHALDADDHYCKEDYGVNGKCSNGTCYLCTRGIRPPSCIMTGNITENIAIMPRHTIYCLECMANISNHLKKPH